MDGFNSAVLTFDNVDHRSYNLVFTEFRDLFVAGFINSVDQAWKRHPL